MSVNRTGKGMREEEDDTFLIFTSQFHIVDFIWQGLCDSCVDLIVFVVVVDFDVFGHDLTKAFLVMFL